MRRFSLKPRRLAEPPRGVGAALLLVAVYAGLASITRLMSYHVDGFTMFWPANGAVVVAMLILPYRSCLAVLLTCFSINMGLNLLTNYAVFDSWVISGLNIFVSYMTAVLTRRLCGATTDLSRLRRLAVFAPVAFLSAGLEAGVGEVIFPTGKVIAEVLHDWLQWALCDGLGLLLSTPAILLSFKNYREADRSEASSLERWGLVVGAALFTMSSFAFLQTPYFLLIFPILGSRLNHSQ